MRSCPSPSRRNRNRPGLICRKMISPKMADQSRSPSSSPERVRVRERAQALGKRAQLADGPKHGELAKAAAAEAEISERNLIAAAERLGVRSRRGQWWLPG
jgi:hypothetical protein